jgi:hypothetical protein
MMYEGMQAATRPTIKKVMHIYARSQSQGSHVCNKIRKRVPPSSLQQYAAHHLHPSSAAKPIYGRNKCFSSALTNRDCFQRSSAATNDAKNFLSMMAIGEGAVTSTEPRIKFELVNE